MNLTQDDLSVRVPLSRSTIARIETGRMNASLEALSVIANYFERPVTEALTEDAAIKFGLRPSSH